MNKTVNDKPSEQALSYVAQAAIKPFRADSLQKPFVDILLKHGFIRLENRRDEYYKNQDVFADFIYPTPEGINAWVKSRESQKKRMDKDH